MNIHLLILDFLCAFLKFILKGEAHQGLIILQKGVELCFPDSKMQSDTKSKLIHGQALLLVGRFMEETANFESNAVMKKYKVSTVVLRQKIFI